jgi:Natural resistance-associated macrophage protein
MAAASAFTGTSDFGHYRDALGLARGLRVHISPAVGAIFALVLFDASIVGASAVTLATSYAFGDMFGLRHSLHRGIADAKLFYGSYAATVAVAAAIVLIPRAPLGLITTAVQALAGILLPSSTVFVVLLCNDRAVLGPWVNRPWLNLVAAVIVSALLVLSMVLVVSTVFPSIDVNRLVMVLGVLMAVAVGAGGVWLWNGQRGAKPEPEVSHADRESWRMPALVLLERPTWSAPRRVAMVVMAGYLVVAVLLLAVKATQLALH